MSLVFRLRTALLMAGVMVLAALAPPALALEPPGAESALSERLAELSPLATLEVVGRRPGPALWRVRRGDTEVVVLGAVSPIPHLQQWDQSRVEHALARSGVLFLPQNRLRFGLIDGAAMFLNQGALKAKGPGGLEASLPPDLRARFERLRDGLKLDPRRYRELKPVVAGLLLLDDFHRAAGLSQDKPGTTVAKMAKADGVEVRMVGDLRAKTFFDAAARMTPAQNQACLSAALDDLEWESAHARPAAAAWAIGDLKTLFANLNPSLLDRCVMQAPTLQEVFDRGVGEGVGLIEGALGRPGTSVAVVDMTFLLRRGGVLDRLKAKGDEIAAPAD
jgi:hypothetical protein